MVRSLLCCAALLGVPAIVQAQTLTRRPYLMKGTPTSMVVVFRTSTSVIGKVSYGNAPGNLTQSQTDAAASTDHVFTIGGLTADTRYYYSVGTATTTLAGGDTEHYFTTSPAVGTAKKTRIWVVGDSGTGDAQQAQVRDAFVRAVRTDRPQLYLHVGDMAYGSGTDSEFTDNFFAPYQDILRNTTLWTTIGNHEGTSSDSASQTGPYYVAYVLPTAAEAGGLPTGTEAYYSFDYANVHFIVLDSHETSRAVNGAMLSWMRNDVMATAQEWVVAFWHHPPYTKGSHDSDTESQLVEMRENALPILEQAGVDLVLTGHSHIYERSFLIDGAYATPTTSAGHIVSNTDGKTLGAGPYVKLAARTAHNGAVYVVAGHGGASVSGSANHPVMYFSELQQGSCVLDIQGNRLEMVNVRKDGAKTDSFAIVKGNGLIVGAPVGGERMNAGATYRIRWVTVGPPIANVKLEFSADNGANWTVVTPGIANTGSYDWMVPATATTLGLVRVSDAANAGVSDESNATFDIVVAGPVDGITRGSEWLYNAAGTDLGTAWLTQTYDDSAWLLGLAELGYGDFDEATLINRLIPTQRSIYFRKHILLDRPVTGAEVEVLFDDGAAVWVNGTQVFAANMGNGTAYDSWASATSSENEVQTQTVSLMPNPFLLGDNVVTAMVKQVNTISSDVSFDLALRLTFGQPAVDAGMVEVDAGTTPVDAAVPMDAAVISEPDAAQPTTPDAAVMPPDAGTVTTRDSGGASMPDANTGEAGGDRPSSCTCQRSGGEFAFLSLVMVAVVPLLRRRRRSTRG